MNSWRGNYIRAFIAIIGLALVFVGVVLVRFVNQYAIGYLFAILGAIIIGIAAYLWYKVFQKG